MLDLRARKCQTGDILDEEHAPAVKKAEIFKALGEMANRFGTRAGESLPKVEKEPSLQRRGNHAFTGGMAVLTAQQ